MKSMAGKKYVILIGIKIGDNVTPYYQLFYWSSVYRDTSYLVTDLSHSLLDKSDKLDNKFLIAEAKHHVDRLNLRSKYDFVEIVEAKDELSTSQRKSEFSEDIIWTN